MSDHDISRRNILTVLGVAAVSTPALAAEHIENIELMKGAPRSIPGIATRSPETQERFAKALENAAAAIRSGEMGCHQMDINSTVKLGEWMEHKVTFTFELGMVFDANKVSWHPGPRGNVGPVGQRGERGPA